MAGSFVAILFFYLFSESTVVLVSIQKQLYLMRTGALLNGRITFPKLEGTTNDIKECSDFTLALARGGCQPRQVFREQNASFLFPGN